MKILLAIDGSPCSAAAVAETARRPWPAGTEVLVIAVDPPVEGAFRTIPTQAFDQIVQQQRAALRESLASSLRTLASGVSMVSCTSRLLEGSPKETIVRTAQDCSADLVVVGSHGYGPVRRFFLGSVSLYVALYAPCSVEIVRDRTVDL